MMRVPARAISVGCPHCHRRVSLESLRIVGSHPGRTLTTCGDIRVEATATLTLDRLCARSVVVHGRVRGPVTASEFVEIGPKGRVIGPICAPKLVVREGGEIQGRFERTSPPAAKKQGSGPENPASHIASDEKHVERETVASIEAPVGPALPVRPRPLPPPRRPA